jgi:quercetin dioxygenase-like cupin family protein
MTRRPDTLLDSLPLATLLGALAGVALLTSCAPAASPRTLTEMPSASGEGLILQASEGERRVRRQPPASLSTLTAPVILKVDRKNGGSPDFVMLTEDIPPGQGISPHRHEHADEILFIHRGTGVALLGTRSATVTAGTTIYIPPNTHISLRNTGTEPLSIVAIFARPGFENYVREISVPEGEQAPPLGVDELSRIRARYAEHVVYERP